MTKSTNIAFFRHSPDLPTPKDVIHIYEVMENWFERLGQTPTHFVADDGSDSGVKYKKYKGAYWKKVMVVGFEGYDGLSLTLMPPRQNPLISMYISFSPLNNTTELRVGINEPYMTFDGEQCGELVRDMAKLWPWDYGFGLHWDVDRSPDLYIMSAKTSGHTQEESRRSEIWYVSSYSNTSVRMAAIRDVFVYNMVGPGHLSRKLPDGRTLEQFIKADPDSELQNLTDKLWLWKVKEDKTETVRERLLGTGVIISE